MSVTHRRRPETTRPPWRAARRPGGLDALLGHVAQVPQELVVLLLAPQVLRVQQRAEPEVDLLRAGSRR